MISTRSSLLPARQYTRGQRREIVGEGEEILNNGVFSRKYGQGRAQVRAGMVASTCGKGCMCVCVCGGCSALQGRMQCTAGAVALHCRDGCSALRLRRAKGTPKSSVLFWIREKEKDCGVFDCKVHKQKRHVKVGLFRMVTESLADLTDSNNHGYNRRMVTIRNKPAFT